ncbi:MAG: hypothetical protein JSW11_06715 [Candidatus Heimdallarchaeota archaeon]|nr:MAG: hypothetical protein JSW11_06715 [Candidatus Heimdallarchaeota archaeon]
MIDEEGIFSLSNTSDRYILFKETIYANERHIGTTWNLTIEISSNSSTGVKFSFESQATDWFEGIKEFQVDPNKARSEVYIAHCTSDETPGFNFLYSLLSPEKNASGIYKIERIHPGYLLDEGSDQSCVWDISAWLKRTISTSYSSIGSSQAVPSLTFILCLITLVYVDLITGKKKA